MDYEDWHQESARRLAEQDAEQERDRRHSRQLLVAWASVSLIAATIDYLTQRDWWAWVVWPIVLGLFVFAIAIIAAIAEWGTKTRSAIKAWLALAVALYLIVWEGGNVSFDYTHKCVRSHVEQVVDREGNESSVRVCDWFSANSKRWTLLDPIRAIARHWKLLLRCPIFAESVSVP